MSTLDRHACAGCGALLEYETGCDGDDDPPPHPYAASGIDQEGPWWSCRCGACGGFTNGPGEPPTLRDALDPATVAALEAEVADAYKRGRQDERRAVSDKLRRDSKKEHAEARRAQSYARQICCEERAGALEWAAYEIRKGRHQQLTSEDDR